MWHFSSSLFIFALAQRAREQSAFYQRICFTCLLVEDQFQVKLPCTANCIDNFLHYSQWKRFFFLIRGVAFEWNLMASCVWAAAKLILQKHFILDNLIVHSNLRLIAYKMKMVFKKNTNTFANMLDPDDSRFSLNFTSIQFEWFATLVCRHSIKQKKKHTKNMHRESMTVIICFNENWWRGKNIPLIAG